ncbi:MAG TPA: hypothetical protein VE177_00660, partial [Candidatus Binatus sp.]|nr:hypothetical protein [Candidatus Binatus sp.]
MLARPVSAENYVLGASPKYSQEVNSGVTLQINVTGAQNFATYTFTWRVTDPTGSVTTVNRNSNSLFGTFSQSVVYPRDFTGGGTNYVGNYTVRVDQTAPTNQNSVANTNFEVGLVPAKTVQRTYLIAIRAQGYNTGENVTIDIQHGGTSLSGFPTFVIANTTQGVASLGWRPPSSTPLGVSTITFQGSSTLKIPRDVQVFTVVATSLTVSVLQVVPAILQRTQSFEVRFAGTYASGVPVQSGGSLVRLIEPDGLTTHFTLVSYDPTIGLFRGTYRVGISVLRGTWAVNVDVNSVDDGYGDVGPLLAGSANVAVQQALLSVSLTSLSQTYNANDKIGLFVTVTDPDGTAFSSGIVTVSLSNNGVQIGNKVDLNYVNAQGYWIGLYSVAQNDPSGQWIVFVDASDAYGNHGQTTGSTMVNAASSGPQPTPPLISLPLFLFLTGAVAAGSVAGGMYLMRGRVATGAGVVPFDTLFELTGGDLPARSTLLILAAKDQDGSGLGLQLVKRYLEMGRYCGLLAYGSTTSVLQQRLKRLGVKPQVYLEKGLLDMLDCRSRVTEDGGVANPLNIVDVGVRVGAMLEKGSGAGASIVLVDSLTDVVRLFPPRKILGFLSFLSEKVKNEKGILILTVEKPAML